MNCKRCGAELDENARFCPQCGALQPLICPECGAESRPGSRVCSNCGKKLPVPVHDEPLVDYPKRKKYTTNKVAIAAIAVGAVLLLTGAVLFLTHTLGDMDKETEPPIEPPSQTEQQDPIPEPIPEPKPETDKTPGKDDKTPVDDPDKQPEDDKQPGEATKPEDDKKPGETTKPEDDKKPGETTKPEDDKKPEEPTKPEDNKKPDETTKPEEPTKPEENKQPEETKPDTSEWIFADSSERLLTQQDIAGMSAEQLRLARNEIYARHGRIFKSQELKDYFNSRTWYKGTIAPNDFKEDSLNEIERANVNFLKAAE